MDVVVLIARILFAILFLFSGIGHVTRVSQMAPYAAGKKVPLPAFSVIVSGLLFGLGALSVLLGVWGDLGALFIAVTVFVTALLMHNFWTLSDPMEKMTDQIQFNKDVALAGGALAFFALYATGMLDNSLTITDGLFNLHF